MKRCLFGPLSISGEQPRGGRNTLPTTRIFTQHRGREAAAVACSKVPRHTPIGCYQEDCEPRVWNTAPRRESGRSSAPTGDRQVTIPTFSCGPVIGSPPHHPPLINSTSKERSSHSCSLKGAEAHSYRTRLSFAPWAAGPRTCTGSTSALVSSSAANGLAELARSRSLISPACPLTRSTIIRSPASYSGIYRSRVASFRPSSLLLFLPTISGATGGASLTGRTPQLPNSDSLHPSDSDPTDSAFPQDINPLRQLSFWRWAISYNGDSRYLPQGRDGH